ncbi:uncharacterized protein DUF948 [Lentzea atacamensis]|uniref:Uncharacterized protein DUF948 n=1 Tax=Lentzea atacamensis TaxID=531938 RepID=A0ABX9E193_9PSEU|nr:DUF948 domain-containing protein [Lentzea atacamensis]RAS62281.1 uncharacterized protein DUF948 [Lentzea atacamensis]
MSPGEIAAWVGAGAFVLVALVVLIVGIKAARFFDKAAIAMEKAADGSDPLFAGANTTLTHVNTQLERVDGITANARAVTGNVSALTSLFTATLGGPLVKAAALSYGVSKAVKARRKAAEQPNKHSKRRTRRGAK